MPLPLFPPPLGWVLRVLCPASCGSRFFPPPPLPQGIREISRQIAEVNEMFQDLAVLINDQGVQARGGVGWGVRSHLCSRSLAPQAPHRAQACQGQAAPTLFGSHPGAGPTASPHGSASSSSSWGRSMYDSWPPLAPPPPDTPPPPPSRSHPSTTTSRPPRSAPRRGRSSWYAPAARSARTATSVCGCG